MLNEISFEAGSLETMIERLFKTMNSIDKQWSEKVEPASQKQIHTLEEIADLKQHGKSIPYAYLLFLEEVAKMTMDCWGRNGMGIQKSILTVY